jgi:hypothetical protein
MIKDVWREGEDGPPVARRPCRGARLINRVSVAEQKIVEREHPLLVGLFTSYLA